MMRPNLLLQTDFGWAAQAVEQIAHTVADEQANKAERQQPQIIRQTSEGSETDKENCTSELDEQ